MDGFKYAQCPQFILCRAAYIRPAADPETRGCKDMNKTWPFLQSAAVGLITLHTWEETSGSCEGREFKWSDHRLSDNAEGCFFGGVASQSVYTLSIAQHCPLLFKEGTMARRFAVFLSRVSVCEEHWEDTIRQARAPGAVKLAVGGQQPSSRACYQLFCARRKGIITTRALQICL